MTYILCHFHEDVMFTSLVIFVGKPKNWLLSIISLCNSLILQIAFGVSHSLSLISHRPLIYRDKNCPTQRDLMGKTPPFWRNIYVLKTPSIHNSSDFSLLLLWKQRKNDGGGIFSTSRSPRPNHVVIAVDKFTSERPWQLLEGSNSCRHENASNCQILMRHGAINSVKYDRSAPSGRRDDRSPKFYARSYLSP